VGRVGSRGSRVAVGHAVRTTEKVENRARSADRRCGIGANLSVMTITATATGTLALGWCGAVIAGCVAATGLVRAWSRTAALAAGAGSPVALLGYAAPPHGPRVVAILGGQVLVGVIVGTLGPVLLRHVAMVTAGVLTVSLWLWEVIAPRGEGGPSDLSQQAAILVVVTILVPLVLVGCRIGEQVRKQRALHG
jgi:hypothetical protein